MSESVPRREESRSLDVDARMNDDERIVRERLAIVRHLLQAQRARRGAYAADPLVPVRSAIASFTERAQSEGWTHAFDAVLATLRAVAAEATPDAAQLAKVADYLAEVEAPVARLARARRESTTREEKVGTGADILRASKDGVPALHLVLASSSSDWTPAFLEPGALVQLRALSLDALDEIASLALLRVPDDEEPWTIGGEFEERLLKMLDAAIALSRGPISLDIVRAARTRAEESPVAEPYRWFVPIFLLACTEGERAMDAMRETLLDAPVGMLESLVDAVCLGSNPARTTIAASLLDEDDRPELLCTALEILARLGGPCDGSVLALLEHPDPEVASRAATTASHMLDPRASVRALIPLLNHESLSAHASSILTLLTPEIGASHLREKVRRGVKEGRSDAALEEAACAAETLAALGNPRDGELLLALAGESDAAFRALATFGSREAFDFLRAEIVRRSSSTWRMSACVPALERITGLLQEDDPEDQARARERWLTGVLAFVVPPGARRVRLGQAFQPSAILDELRYPGTHMRTRRNLAQEARLLGALPIPIDLEGWIAPQRAWLDRVKKAGWPAATGDRP